MRSVFDVSRKCQIDYIRLLGFREPVLFFIIINNNGHLGCWDTDHRYRDLPFNSWFNFLYQS